MIESKANCIINEKDVIENTMSESNNQVNETLEFDASEERINGNNNMHTNHQDNNDNHGKDSERLSLNCCDGAERHHSITSVNTEKNASLWYRVVPALSSGAVQAVLFNPIDRALYLRVTFRRQSFLDRRNFDRPFQGFMNAAVYRTLVGACYLFWQDTFNFYIQEHLPSWCQESAAPQLNAMLIGLAAGASNGLILNSLQAIKFRMWNENAKDISFWKTARLMYTEAGWRIFLRGSLTTVVRDSTFGIIYEITRRSSLLYQVFNYLLCKQTTPTNTRASVTVNEEQLRRQLKVEQVENVDLIKSENNSESKSNEITSLSLENKANSSNEIELKEQLLQLKEPRNSIANANSSSLLSCHPVSRFGFSAFLVNLIAAMTASVLSSPLNYVRNVIYGTPHSAVPLGYWVLLRSFYTQFIYIFTHGESYVVRHGTEEWAEHERIKNVKAKSRSTATATPSTTSNADTFTNNTTFGNRNHNKHTHRFEERQTSTMFESKNVDGSILANMRRWFAAHKYYPKAAWRWSNSRLNIGWGSIRVGVGVALSQSCFYLVQDWFNRKSTKSTLVNASNREHYR